MSLSPLVERFNNLDPDTRSEYQRRQAESRAARTDYLIDDLTKDVNRLIGAWDLTVAQKVEIAEAIRTLKVVIRS